MRKIYALTVLIILVLAGCSSIGGQATREDATDPGTNTIDNRATPATTSAISTSPPIVDTPLNTDASTTAAAGTSDSPPPGPLYSLPPTGGALIVQESLAQRTIACDDGSVIINGSMNRITFTGSCETALTNGSLNHITFEQVESIDINGAKNEVTWKGGRTSSAPRVNDRGFGNLVNQG